MSVTLYITIDTEEDLWDNYRSRNNPVDNISKIPELQKIFDRYNAIPTYLINYPVAINPKAMKTILNIFDAGRCEIGAHCHPWNTPPFEEEANSRNTMICNLDSVQQLKKLENLHESIFNAASVEAKSFRAGRWGFGLDTANCLIRLGYSIDTSVTPFTDWTRFCGPDFTEAPTKPYLINDKSVLTVSENGRLMEVPVTIGFLQKNMKLCAYLRKNLLKPVIKKIHILGALNRLKLLNYRWLSPETTSAQDMVKLAKTFTKTGHQSLNMFLHTTALVPGKSPFVSDYKQLKRLLRRIDVFLDFAAQNNIKFSRLIRA